jgi:hypothetical protein
MGGSGASTPPPMVSPSLCTKEYQLIKKERKPVVFTAKNGMEQLPGIYGMSQLHSSIEGNFPLSFYHKNMEIILNSCDSKPPCRDLNLQPLVHCSDTLATSTMNLTRNKLILEVWY